MKNQLLSLLFILGMGYFFAQDSWASSIDLHQRELNEIQAYAHRYNGARGRYDLLQERYKDEVAKLEELENSRARRSEISRQKRRLAAVEEERNRAVRAALYFKRQHEERLRQLDSNLLGLACGLDSKDSELEKRLEGFKKVIDHLGKEEAIGYWGHLWNTFLEKSCENAYLFGKGFISALIGMGLEIVHIGQDTGASVLFLVFDRDSAQFYEIKSGLIEALATQGFVETLKNIPDGLYEGIVGNFLSGDPERMGEGYANFALTVLTANAAGSAAARLPRTSVPVPQMTFQPVMSAQGSAALAPALSVTQVSVPLAGAAAATATIGGGLYFASSSSSSSSLASASSSGRGSPSNSVRVDQTKKFSKSLEKVRKSDPQIYRKYQKFKEQIENGTFNPQESGWRHHQLRDYPNPNTFSVSLNMQWRVVYEKIGDAIQLVEIHAHRYTH